MKRKLSTISVSEKDSSKKQYIEQEQSGELSEDVRVWDDAINEDIIDKLENEANILWNYAGGDRKQARSFWIPKEAKPRCYLEKFALDVVKMHTQNYNNDGDGQEEAEDTIIGAEFWVQTRKTEDKDPGLELHFDKDEEAFSEWGIFSHPAKSTATYLSEGGAPLLVYSTRSEEGILGSDSDVEEGNDEEGSELGEPDNAPAPTAWVVSTRRGRHVLFDGCMLHGIPAELLSLTGKDNYTRTSLLVNLWSSHQPEGLKRLPVKSIDGISVMKEKDLSEQPTLSLHQESSTNASLEFPIHIMKSKANGTDILYVNEHREGETFPLPKSTVKATLLHTDTDTGTGPGVLGILYED